MYQAESIVQAKKLINDAQTIVILAPDSQDGDSISTNIALLTTLKSMGKHVLWVAADGRDKKYDFLKGNLECHTPDIIDHKQDDVDLVIITDAGGVSMFEKVLTNRRWLIEDKQTILFDHHMVRDDFHFTVDIIGDYAATGELLYHVYQDMEWEITPDVATALLLGIYNDTQLFTNLNTNKAVLEVAAALAGLGANPATLAEAYKTAEAPDPEGFLLLEKALSTARFELPIAYVLVERDIVKAAPSGTSIRHYIGNALRYINGVKISFVIVEKEDDLYQLSMRCHKGYDVASIAQKFGGGGHTVAAGANLHGFSSLAQAAQEVLKYAREEADRHI